MDEDEDTGDYTEPFDKPDLWEQLYGEDGTKVPGCYRTLPAQTE